MTQLEKEIEKTVKKYTEDFKSFYAKLEKLDKRRREFIEKRILRYFYKCQNVKVLPEPQDCVDILNEMQAV